MRLAGVWLVAALSLASVALAPIAARAQPFQGVYIGAGAGYNIPQNIQIVTNVPLAQRHYLNSGNGFGTIGSLGYGLGNGFRFEIEGDYRQDAFKGLIGEPFANTGSGKIQTYGVMGNVLFDMDIGFPWLYPYVGGGVGYQRTHLNNVSVISPGYGTVFQSSSTEGGFAFQAIAGLSFPIPHVPGLSLTTEYRFLGIPESETFPASFGSADEHIKVNRQFTNTFLVGVRYAFGVQPPPPPPAPASAPPAPAPARTFQIFFDWDKATLTDRARQIVKEAAEGSTKVQTTRIEVNGYTDTSGSPQYNKGLSIRRAEAVAAELVKDGVARNIISIQGFGDTKLLVPTGPGVREPQNRRVEIILH
jgi:outer membrane protein OmpA-like peptidoglycan-associated protein